MTSALRRPHVLIVSDDTDLSDFLGEGLVYAGFWTSVIAGALQALEVFRLRSFDVILLDAALGGIGALELVRRLRGRSDRAPSGVRTDVPVLLVAASADEVAPERAVAAGADGILVAPVELPDLAQRLHETVAAWRAAHPERPWADEAALAQ
jgi:CheY-like chemotaxis protein